MKTLERIIWAGLLAASLAFGTCETTKQQLQQIPGQRDTVTKWLPRSLDLRPVAKLQIDTLPGDTVFVTADTAAILHAYSRRLVYRRTWADSNFTASLADTLEHCQIRPGDFHFTLTYKIPERTITVNQIREPAGFYLGAFAGPKSLGITASLVKRKNLLQVGADLRQTAVFVSYQRKLSFESSKASR